MINKQEKERHICDYIVTALQDSHRTISTYNDSTAHCMAPGQLMNQVATRNFNSVNPMNYNQYQFALDELFQEGRLAKLTYSASEQDPSYMKDYEVIALMK